MSAPIDPLDALAVGVRLGFGLGIAPEESVVDRLYSVTGSDSDDQLRRVMASLGLEGIDTADGLLDALEAHAAAPMSATPPAPVDPYEIWLVALFHGYGMSDAEVRAIEDAVTGEAALHAMGAIGLSESARYDDIIGTVLRHFREAKP